MEAARTKWLASLWGKGRAEPCGEDQQGPAGRVVPSLAPARLRRGQKASMDGRCGISFAQLILLVPTSIQARNAQTLEEVTFGAET